MSFIYTLFAFSHDVYLLCSIGYLYAITQEMRRFLASPSLPSDSEVFDKQGANVIIMVINPCVFITWATNCCCLLLSLLADARIKDHWFMCNLLNFVFIVYMLWYGESVVDESRLRYSIKEMMTRHKGLCFEQLHTLCKTNGFAVFPVAAVDELIASNKNVNPCELITQLADELHKTKSASSIDLAIVALKRVYQ